MVLVGRKVVIGEVVLNLFGVNKKNKKDVYSSAEKFGLLSRHRVFRKRFALWSVCNMRGVAAGLQQQRPLATHPGFLFVVKRLGARERFRNV